MEDLRWASRRVRRGEIRLWGLRYGAPGLGGLEGHWVDVGYHAADVSLLWVYRDGRRWGRVHAVPGPWPLPTRTTAGRGNVRDIV